MQAYTGRIYAMETENETKKITEIIKPKIDFVIDDSAREVKRVNIEEMPSNTLAEKVKIGKDYRNVRLNVIGRLLAASDTECCIQSESRFYIVPKVEAGEWLRIKDANE
jgi:hypothetical protein